MTEEYAVPATGAIILNEEDDVFLMKSPKWGVSGWFLAGRLRKVTQ